MGMTGLATATNVNRVNLYRMLSKKGNPGVKNIRAILRALKLKLDVVDEDHEPSAKLPVPVVPVTAQQNEQLGPSSSQTIKETLGSSSAPENYPVGESDVSNYDSPVMIPELSDVRYLLPIVGQRPSQFTVNP
jgi:hypothetical protein